MNENQACVQRIAEQLEEKGVYDFFEEQDIYDIEYTIDSNFEFKSARVMIACGGPNIFVNSRSGSVDLYWWTEEAHWYLNTDCKTAVEDYFEEMYQIIKQQ